MAEASSIDSSHTFSLSKEEDDNYERFDERDV
jgi:hypothetical protein